MFFPTSGSPEMSSFGPPTFGSPISPFPTPGSPEMSFSFGPPTFGSPLSPFSSRASPFGSVGSVPYRVLRVLEDATSPGAWPPRSTQRYYPDAAVSLAEAHSWVPYGTFISFLRDLMTGPFDEHDTTKLSLRNFFMNLAQRLPPFSVNTRFPAGEFYVCVDRAPLGLPLLRISHGLALGAGTENGCREYYQGAREAMEMLTGDDTKASPPDVYNRRIFESVFGLQWVD